MDNNILEQFIEEVFKQAGLDKLPEDFRKEYREKLAVEAQKRLGIIAMRELDKQDMDEFELLVTADEPDQQKIGVFLKARIPNFEEKVKEALQQFAREFIQSVQNLKATA